MRQILDPDFGVACGQALAKANSLGQVDQIAKAITKAMDLIMLPPLEVESVFKGVAHGKENQDRTRQ